MPHAKSRRTVKRHEFLRSSGRSDRFTILLRAALVLLAGSVQAWAADRMDLPVVKPVMTCDQLAKINLGNLYGYPATITSSMVMETPKGQFCRVTGKVQQSTLFEIDLPLEHWTQRFLELASNSSAISNAGSCAPAVNGEFAVAFTGGGGGGDQGRTGLRGDTRALDLQLRIDSAYRGSHASVLASKAVIKAFYGQPHRFAYFMGCSGGGRQAMQEVERFPEDFDGVSAGSPVLIDSQHNIFYHPWESYINKRTDGRRILATSRIGILHDAVMAHCAAVSGNLDDVLLQPTACKFDPAWVQCPAGAADTSMCMTAEEVGVAGKLYEGPGDGKGHHFEIAGFSMGSEKMWGLSTADHVANPEAKEGRQMKRLLPPPESNKDNETLENEFRFNQEWFEKTLVLSPLFNAANTNIRAFRQHGGKLILWNGAEDLTVQPEISVAYYQGVQKELGTKTTDSFMRLFIIPGFGHCEGGEIPFQMEILEPLMAWTELHRVPAMILAGKAADDVDRPSLYARDGGVHNPVGRPDLPNKFTRPIYPFPNMAHYSGKGDPYDAASYESVKSGAPVPQKFDTEVKTLIGPNTQKFYHVENGKMLPDNH
jgi:feruloyl esterase